MRSVSPSSDLLNMRVVGNLQLLAFGVRSQGYVGWRLYPPIFAVRPTLGRVHLNVFAFYRRGDKFQLLFSQEALVPIYEVELSRKGCSLFQYQCDASLLGQQGLNLIFQVQLNMSFISVPR